MPCRACPLHTEPMSTLSISIVSYKPPSPSLQPTSNNSGCLTPQSSCTSHHRTGLLTLTCAPNYQLPTHLTCKTHTMREWLPTVSPPLYTTSHHRTSFFSCAPNYQQPMHLTCKTHIMREWLSVSPYMSQHRGKTHLQWSYLLSTYLPSYASETFLPVLSAYTLITYILMDLFTFLATYFYLPTYIQTT